MEVGEDSDETLDLWLNLIPQVGRSNEAFAHMHGLKFSGLFLNYSMESQPQNLELGSLE